MKIKPAIIGILLMGLISACGVNDSHKETFNPHIDGLRGYHYPVPVFCTEKEVNVCYQLDIFTYLKVDYPYLHACFESFKPVDGKDKRLKTLKEDVEVTHKNGNIYRIKTINGQVPAEGTEELKIENDSNDVVIYRKVRGEWKSNYGYSKNEGALFNLTQERYRQCRANAKDSTGLFYLRRLPSYLKKL